jgi:hypothetical protein
MVTSRPLSVKSPALLLAVALCIAGCSCDRSVFDKVKHSVEAEIKAGDGRDKVESVLERVGANYGYDDSQSRYQANFFDDGCGDWIALTIYVNLNEKGVVSNVEMFKSYTGC